MPETGRFQRPFISLRAVLVVGAAVLDGLLEVGVLRLDDLVGVVAVMDEVTRSTELSARHALHLSLLSCW